MLIIICLYQTNIPFFAKGIVIVYVIYLDISTKKKFAILVGFFSRNSSQNFFLAIDFRNSGQNFFFAILVAPQKLKVIFFEKMIKILVSQFCFAILVKKKSRNSMFRNPGSRNSGPRSHDFDKF